jgi:hypothetical protein
MQASSAKIAKRFIRDQIAIMKKYGKAPTINPETMKKVLADTQASFESLRGLGGSRRHV